MKKLLPNCYRLLPIWFLLPGLAFAGTEPMNVNTANGHVKETSSGVGATPKPFNFVDVSVAGILPSPSPTGTYVLGAVNGVLQWLPTTACPTPTPTPTPTPP